MMGTAWIDFQAWTMRRMDALAGACAWTRAASASGYGRTGREGGAVLSAEDGLHRSWPGGGRVRSCGEISIWLGGMGDWLCFIEVKTRSGRDAMTAESAVDGEKQDMLRRMARAYLRGFPEKLRKDVPVTVRCGVGILAAIWS